MVPLLLVVGYWSWRGITGCSNDAYGTIIWHHGRLHAHLSYSSKWMYRRKTRVSHGKPGIWGHHHLCRMTDRYWLVDTCDQWGLAVSAKGSQKFVDAKHSTKTSNKCTNKQYQRKTPLPCNCPRRMISKVCHDLQSQVTSVARGSDAFQHHVESQECGQGARLSHSLSRWKVGPHRSDSTDEFANFQPTKTTCQSRRDQGKSLPTNGVRYPVPLMYHR